MGEAEQRRNRAREHFLDEGRHLHAAHVIDFGEHRQRHDGVELRLRRARDIAAVGVEAGFEYLAQPGLAEYLPRLAAGHQQRGGDDADPRDHLPGAGPRLFGDAVEVACRAREMVEHRRPIDKVARRQDQRRVARPEEDAPRAVVGLPRGLAQPGEAVEIVGKGRRDGERREIELAERQFEPAMQEMAGADRGARARIAGHRVGRYAEQLQRKAPLQAEGVERCAPRQARDRIGDAVAEREPLVGGQADQPLAGFDRVVDGVGGGALRFIFWSGHRSCHVQAPPRSRRILSA